MDSIIGRTILGYKVIERIGSGGFGDVYKVERNNIVGNVTRALKVITLPRDNEYIEILNSMGGDKEKANSYFDKELDRVINEIRVFSMISEKDNHHIVSYYESDVEKVGEYRYNIYILMEYLTPLDKWMQVNNMTVENALDIGIGIADALDICHKNGIIHRDIKVSNIFVSKDGTFKIGDFGVSKNINNATMAKTIKGTPNYIAPEVYIGKSKYDSSVDNYSLGILLYYLFNKFRFPYYPNFPNEYTQEDSDKAFYKRMNYEKLEAPVCAPLSVANIIKKAISTPSERYTKAKDMAKDLSDAKTNLTKDELEVKIGFEPKANTDEWIENDKERKLVQDLNGESQSDVSFIEQGITVFEKRDESKVEKNKKYAIVGLVMAGIIVVIIFAKNVMNDRHSKEKLPSQIQTSEFVNENNTNISEGKEDMNADGNDVNADGTGDGINTVENDSNANEIKDGTNANVNQSGSITGTDNNLNQNNSGNNNQIGEPENIETTKKAKKKQPETTKQQQEITTTKQQQEITTKKQQQATTQKHYNSTPKPTQKPTEKKEDNFDFKSVVE